MFLYVPSFKTEEELRESKFLFGFLTLESALSNARILIDFPSDITMELKVYVFRVHEVILPVKFRFLSNEKTYIEDVEIFVDLSHNNDIRTENVYDFIFCDIKKGVAYSKNSGITFYHIKKNSDFNKHLRWKTFSGIKNEYLLRLKSREIPKNTIDVSIENLTEYVSSEMDSEVEIDTILKYVIKSLIEYLLKKFPETISEYDISNVFKSLYEEYDKQLQ